jgi:TolA-binding protein
MRPLAALVLLAMVAGCGGALGQGESEFAKGQYPEAKQTFASAETESRGWSDSRRAEYALYRGLTLGALGDRGQAAVWLREAKAIEDTHTGSLSAEDARRLHIGLGSTEGE